MLIGITGAAGAGKDTAADWLVNQKGFTKYSFADPIYEACQAIFPYLDWRDRATKEAELDFLPGFSKRKILQILGTEFARDMINTNFWLIVADQRMKAGGDFVIPDVRFDNEYEWIKSKGGIVLKVVRPGMRVIEESDHASEAGVESYDWLLTNDKDVARLHSAMQVMWMHERRQQLIDGGF